MVPLFLLEYRAVYTYTKRDLILVVSDVIYLSKTSKQKNVLLFFLSNQSIKQGGT